MRDPMCAPIHFWETAWVGYHHIYKEPEANPKEIHILRYQKQYAKYEILACCLLRVCVCVSVGSCVSVLDREDWLIMLRQQSWIMRFLIHGSKKESHKTNEESHKQTTSRTWLWISKSRRRNINKLIPYLCERGRPWATVVFHTDSLTNYVIR